MGTQRRLSNKEREIEKQLKELIKQHGFSIILSLLENLASDNADDSCNESPWNLIQKNLNDSVLEIEEWALGKDIN